MHPRAVPPFRQRLGMTGTVTAGPKAMGMWRLHNPGLVACENPGGERVKVNTGKGAVHVFSSKLLFGVHQTVSNVKRLHAAGYLIHVRMQRHEPE